MIRSWTSLFLLNNDFVWLCGGFPTEATCSIRACQQEVTSLVVIGNKYISLEITIQWNRLYKICANLRTIPISSSIKGQSRLASRNRTRWTEPRHKGGGAVLPVSGNIFSIRPKPRARAYNLSRWPERTKSKSNSIDTRRSTKVVHLQAIRNACWTWYEKRNN